MVPVASVFLHGTRTITRLVQDTANQRMLSAFTPRAARASSAPIFASTIDFQCGPVVKSTSPLLATLGGCLIILVAIVIQLELFGLLSRRQLIPSAFSRKLTHIGAGTAMTTALVVFPHRFWPARLAVSLSLVAFMLLFAIIAHMPERHAVALPPLLRSRLDSLVCGHTTCTPCALQHTRPLRRGPAPLTCPLLAGACNVPLRRA